MRIEKLSDNQIRCILTREDLARRHLKLNELAYGSDKARLLFRDMMQQAAYQYGFEAEDIPLMIEAVPLPSDSIALIVTKVENPEELDTRFSSFAPSVQETPGQEDREKSVFEQLLDAIRRSASDGEAVSDVSSRAGRETAEKAPEKTAGGAVAAQGGSEAQKQYFKELNAYLLLNRLFLFGNMRDLIAAAGQAAPFFGAESMLYRNEDTGVYELVIHISSPDEVSGTVRARAAISEFGSAELLFPARHRRITEHDRLILSEKAIEQLSGV
jgi:adapter protein MecA 1/2